MKVVSITKSNAVGTSPSYRHLLRHLHHPYLCLSISPHSSMVVQDWLCCIWRYVLINQIWIQDTNYRICQSLRLLRSSEKLSWALVWQLLSVLANTTECPRRPWRRSSTTLSSLSTSSSLSFSESCLLRTPQLPLGYVQFHILLHLPFEPSTNISLSPGFPLGIGILLLGQDCTILGTYAPEHLCDLPWAVGLRQEQRDN